MNAESKQEESKQLMLEGVGTIAYWWDLWAVFINLHTFCITYIMENAVGREETHKDGW